jgi:hypothetical protein
VDAGGTGHPVAPCSHVAAGVLVGFHGAAAVEQSLKREGQRLARALMGEAMDGVGGQGERAAVSEGVADSLESRAGAGPTIAQSVAPSLESCGRGQISSEAAELAAKVVVDWPDRGEGRQGGQRTVGMEEVAAARDRLEERCLQPCKLRVFAGRDDVLAPHARGPASKSPPMASVWSGHAGAALLRELADRVRLTRALGWRAAGDRRHPDAAVLRDLAVMLPMVATA